MTGETRKVKDVISGMLFIGGFLVLMLTAGVNLF